jgi:ABC-type sugar transport system ATPase subunit
VVAGVRPERLRGGEAGAGRSLRGTVLLVEALGSDLLAHITLDQVRPLDDAQAALANDVEDAAEAEELTSDAHATIVARLDPRPAVDAGSVIEVSAAPGSLYFFDSQTGLSLDEG